MFVERKQFRTHLRTEFQKTFIFSIMNVFWNSVLRWVLNCFRATNIAALTREAAVPPLSVYCLYLGKRHALRVCASSPLLNPASIRLPPSFPSIGTAPLGARSLLVGLGQRAPKPWTSIASTRPRSILIDNIIISILEFLPRNLHTNFKAIPPNPPPQSIKQDIKGISDHIKGQMIRDWDKLLPAPPYYKYSTSTTPSKHLKFSKFMAGRVSQMRAHKSYLRAHPSWAQSNSSLCPLCEESDQDFEHAILYCPALSNARELYIPNIDSIGPVSSLWENELQLASLAEFIKTTRTNFPTPKVLQYVLSSSKTSDELTDISLLSFTFLN